MARLIQNGFTGEAKADEARKTGFFRLLVYFNPRLQNGFALQCLDLRKIDEAEAGINRAKEALYTYTSRGGYWARATALGVAQKTSYVPLKFSWPKLAAHGRAAQFCPARPRA